MQLIASTPKKKRFQIVFFVPLEQGKARTRAKRTEKSSEPFLSGATSAHTSKPRALARRGEKNDKLERGGEFKPVFNVVGG